LILVCLCFYRAPTSGAVPSAMVEVSYDIPSGLPDAGILSISATRLATLPEASEREDALQTLFKLVDGVLAAPEEPKKRKVRKANEVFHRKVGRHEAGLEFLSGVGFKESDDPDTPGDEGRGGLLTMQTAFMLRLTDAHHTLAYAAQEAGLPAPPLPQVKSGGAFNPYLSSSQAVDTTRKGPSATGDWKTEADRVRDEVRRKEQEAKQKVEMAPPVDMNPSAFWLAKGRRLEDMIREATNPSEDRAADNALLQDQLSCAKGTISGPGKFESADKKRLVELNRKRVHETCILRIICPDKSVLQVTFRSPDKGAHVLEQIKPLLAPAIQDTNWFVYQTPPMTKLAPRETLVKGGFTPGANLYLGFDGEKPAAPYLEASLVAQMGPPPEAERGVTQVGGVDINPAAAKFSGEAMGWGQGKRAAPNPSVLLGGGSSGGSPDAAAGGSSNAAASVAAALPGGQRLGGGPCSEPTPMETD